MKREKSWSKGNKRQRTRRDPFQLVPDDVLLSIFNKIDDFKFVCRCSLVCTRFASVITYMDSVTVSFSSKECDASAVQTHVRQFRDKKSCLQSQVTPKMDIACLRQTLGFINCLRKFKELKALHIKFSYGLKAWSSSLLEWKAKFGTELECVVTLLPGWVGKIDQEDPEQDNGQLFRTLSESELEQRLYMAYGCCQEAVVRQTLSFMLIDHHPLLKIVTVTDNEKQGMMRIEQEQILKLRDLWMNRDLDQIFEAVKVPHIFKVGYVPEVRLRGLGYILKGVLLLIFKPHVSSGSGTGGSDDGDFDLLNWDYDGEDVFRETVKEILTNHNDKMHLVPKIRDVVE